MHPPANDRKGGGTVDLTLPLRERSVNDNKAQSCRMILVRKRGSQSDSLHTDKQIIMALMKMEGTYWVSLREVPCGGLSEVLASCSPDSWAGGTSARSRIVLTVAFGLRH